MRLSRLQNATRAVTIAVRSQLHCNVITSSYSQKSTSADYDVITCSSPVEVTIRRLLPRDAMLSMVYAIVMCLCVCVSVTLRYCIKTAKRRITQIMPHDSPLTLVFWHWSSRRNSNGITPYEGDKCRGWVKIRHFRRKTRYNSKAVQDTGIVSINIIGIIY